MASNECEQAVAGVGPSAASYQQCSCFRGNPKDACSNTPADIVSTRDHAGQVGSCTARCSSQDLSVRLTSLMPLTMLTLLQGCGLDDSRGFRSPSASPRGFARLPVVLAPCDPAGRARLRQSCTEAHEELRRDTRRRARRQAVSRRGSGIYEMVAGRGGEGFKRVWR